VDPDRHPFVLPLPSIKELNRMEAESSFFYENILQKLFKFRPNFVVPVTDCHFGSPIIRVSTNLYEIDSWLGLIKANAVSAFPKNV